VSFVAIFTKGVSDSEAGQTEAQYCNKSQNIHMVQPSFPRFPFRFLCIEDICIEDICIEDTLYTEGHNPSERGLTAYQRKC